MAIESMRLLCNRGFRMVIGYNVASCGNPEFVAQLWQSTASQFQTLIRFVQKPQPFLAHFCTVDSDSQCSTGVGISYWLERTVRNAAVHGESGWSSFWEREVKAKVAFVVRVLEEDGLVARVGRACLMEIGVKSKWWKKIGKMTEELGVDVLSNLVWLRRMSAIGVAEMGICEDERKRMSKVELERRIKEVERTVVEEMERGEGRGGFTGGSTGVCSNIRGPGTTGVEECRKDLEGAKEERERKIEGKALV
ncbi:hypothetical protein CAPTEDRAFT_185937 [Capitella teleta]|uniref:Uncharacterized protein n=1 Tax=Capitella teleta TaxID=283909 RepID=R7UHB8_CAPTE|nr:hypothetical protein CAPTEDRAFT_185937 [Capitella teleta]|eukprot:ELU05939.1 hypothetical protein CAPTEDRAFT_185937 [Capitella teleta]